MIGLIWGFSMVIALLCGGLIAIALYFATKLLDYLYYLIFCKFFTKRPYISIINFK